MIQLTIEQVLQMHNLMIIETGGTNGVRDMALLDMAMSGAFQTFDGQDIYPSFDEKGARLVFSIVTNHPFVDGNKRMGLFVMLVFFELNGNKLVYSQQELIDLGMGLANGTVTDEMVLKWVQSHK